MRNWLITLAATSALLWATQYCEAQGVNKPTVSPYLSLVQPNGNPALNYYNQVRPQVAFGNAIQKLQQGAQADQNAFLDPQQSGMNQLPATGHAAGFGTYQRYFGTVVPGAAQSRNAGTFARPKSGR